MRLRVSLYRPVNQDAVVLNVVKYEDDKQYYCKEIVWQEFNDFDVLNSPAFPGNPRVTVEVSRARDVIEL